MVSGACSNTDYLAVHLAAAGSGTAGDTLEFQVNGTGLEHWSNPSSAAVPAADSASDGALAVGAVDPATGTTIGFYSSQGPTNDNRTKPDISAASCVASFTYSPDCFNGTSAAAPVAAGAAAIIRGSGLADTPAAIKSYFLTNAFIDRGAVGTDNVFGVGELRLPNPAGPNTAPTISDIADQSTAQDTPKGPIGFTVGDAQTAPGSLVVTASSSNTALVPNGGIALGGSGAARTMTLTPAAGQAGSTTITVTVTDGALSAHDSFVLAVNAAGCADDGREPDDSIGTAKPISSGVPVVGTACDDDYSALSVVAGQTINAGLAFTNANGDLDLRLYGPAGTLLGTSAGHVDSEHITYGPAAAGTYAIRVYPLGGAANHNGYTLTATAADVTHPTWTARSPSSGSTGVARDTRPYLAFSEALNPATVTGSTVRLRDTTAGAFVPATVTYDPGTRRANLRPSSLLAPGHHFKVSASAGIRDVAGNTFAGDVLELHGLERQDEAQGVGAGPDVRRDRRVPDREHQGHVQRGHAGVDADDRDGAPARLDHRRDPHGGRHLRRRQAPGDPQPGVEAGGQAHLPGPAVLVDPGQGGQRAQRDGLELQDRELTGSRRGSRGPVAAAWAPIGRTARNRGSRGAPPLECAPCPDPSS